MTGLSVSFPHYQAGVDIYIRALPVQYRYRPGEPKQILKELFRVWAWTVLGSWLEERGHAQ
jgi:hypothetical protein